MIREVANVIHHKGIVEKIDGNKCYVRILQHSSCSGCAAHKLCNSSESKEKIVEVLLFEREIQVGDTVDVEGTVTQGLRAVYICYMIPLAFMVFFLFIGERWGGDLIAIVSSMLFLAIYYYALYMCRNHMGKRLGFTIHKV